MEQFDKFEKDRKENEEIIKNLEGKVYNLTKTVAKLIKKKHTIKSNIHIGTVCWFRVYLQLLLKTQKI